MLRGGAYTDCAERWIPGILSRPPPRRVGGRGASETVWCAGVCGALLRWVRVDPKGWGVAVAALRQGTRMRIIPTREKRSVSLHAPQHAHRERVALERNHARHAHVLRNRTRSLLGSQSKEVCE